MRSRDYTECFGSDKGLSNWDLQSESGDRRNEEIKCHDNMQRVSKGLVHGF